MEIGITASCSDQSVDPSTLARMVEEAGFDLVGFGEHSHMPVERESAYPGGAGSLPPGYERLIELFVCLTAAALATSRIKIASNICQVVQRDPIHTAKAVASVDHISNGRMVLVTGSGWNVAEMRNHGTDPDTRYELLEERVLAMREIWSAEEATFHGRFVNFDRIWSWPKPVQETLPVVIGGNSEGVEERALRVGTGWAVHHRPGVLERIRAYLDRAERDGLQTSVVGVGGPLTAENIDDYAKAGAERWTHSVGVTLEEGELATKLERANAVRAEFAGTP